MSETTLPPDSAPPPVVSILVISYNTKAMTLDCLCSISEQTTIPHEVVVVDNNSHDGSAEAIAEAYPEVKLVASPVNHGFAKGNNIAAKYARGEYILLLNSDTVVLDQAIDRIVAFARDKPEAKVWGGRTVFADGSLNVNSCWELPSAWNIFCRTAGLNAIFPKSPLFNSEAYPDWKRDSVREVDMIVGCFLLMDRKLWDQLEGFDETMFMYGDDVELCIRARKLGAVPYITPAATIIHYKGASDTVRADRMVRLMSAKVTIVKRYFAGWRRPFSLTTLRLWPYSRVVAMTALAAVTRKPRFQSGRDAWSEIWARRALWWNGY